MSESAQTHNNPTQSSMDPQAIAALIAQVMQQMRLASPTPEPQETYASNVENQLTRQYQR